MSGEPISHLTVKGTDFVHVHTQARSNPIHTAIHDEFVTYRACPTETVTIHRPNNAASVLLEKARAPHPTPQPR